MEKFVLVGVFWLIPTTIMGIVGLRGEEPGFGLGCLLVGWGPVALITWLDRRRLGKRDAAWAHAHAMMLEAGGVLAGQGLDHSEEGTGIAVNPQKRTVTLLAGKVFKSYGYEDVRHWEAREERAGNAVGVGVAGALAAGAVNTRNAEIAADNTGFFVTVRDRQTPEWRIVMKNGLARARWLEIMEQEINESRRAASN